MAKIVSRGDPIEPVYLNNLRVAAHGWGIISGLAVSQRGAGANMSVDVALGGAWINGTRVLKTSTTNVVITAAHASYDRYDLVVINSSGTISVIAGTAAATSYANDYDLETNNAILLAEVYVPATDTTIEDAQITDKHIISFVEEINYNINVGLEEYSNHLGATDNFTQTVTDGNGTATADTTNHEMDLSTGITVAGYAIFESKKSWTLGTKPLIINMIMDNFVGGAGGDRLALIGLKNDFTGGSTYQFAGFYSAGITWIAATRADGSQSVNGVSISNGDILTIVATSSAVEFYINGSLVAKNTTNIPDDPLKIGMVVDADGAGVTTAMSLSYDMMGIKVYC